MKVKEIEPELTAEEIIHTLGEICTEYKDCIKCPLYSINISLCNPQLMLENSERIVNILTKWKSKHEKKAPEIETVDICRIIKILPDGRKHCVHEEDIKPDPELPYGSEQLAAEEMLKAYCMEHEGEFIAVHEVVSRVKAIN